MLEYIVDEKLNKYRIKYRTKISPCKQIGYVKYKDLVLDDLNKLDYVLSKYETFIYFDVTHLYVKESQYNC